VSSLHPDAEGSALLTFPSSSPSAGRTAVIIVRIGSRGRQDFSQPILDVQLELGGDLDTADAVVFSPARNVDFVITGEIA
jgi:hypothetical protein